MGNYLPFGWEGHRQGVEIRVFGSFQTKHLAVLDALIDHLQAVGYAGARRMPSSAKREPDEKILADCCEAARTAALAIFIFFDDRGDPNQSTTIELKERIDKVESVSGRLPGPHNTLVLFEAGCEAKSLLRGALGRASISSLEKWRHQEDLDGLVSGWLLSLCLDEDGA